MSNALSTQGSSPVQDETFVQKNMESQKEKLIELIDSECGLLDKLRKSRTLTLQEEAKVKAKETIFDKNEKLLELIFNKNKCLDLFRALQDTKQLHLVNFMMGNGEYKAEYGLNWPLMEKECDVLDDNHEFLINSLDTCDLLNRLFSSSIVNERQLEFINSKRTSHEKNEALVSILRRGSLAKFQQTITCLRLSNQHHIAEVLEHGGAVVPVHAVIEAVNLDETEDEIVTQITNLVMGRSVERVRALLVEAQLRIYAARKGDSVVLYVYCRRLQELLYLCELVDNAKLKSIIEDLFKLLIQHTNTRVLDVNVRDSDIEKARNYFQREASCDYDQDEGISRQMQQEKLVATSAVEHGLGRLTFEQKELEEKVCDDYDEDDYDYDNDDDEDKSDSSADDSDQSGEGKEFQTDVDLIKKLEEESEVESPVGAIACTPDFTKDDAIAAIIRNNTDFLKEHIIPEGLIDGLHATGCLSDDDTRYIKTLKYQVDKCDEILNLIDGNFKYRELIRCLRLKNQQLPADILESGGVVLKVKLTLKRATNPELESKILKSIRKLHDKSEPKTDDTVRFLRQLRFAGLEFLDAQSKNGFFMWLWCRSAFALRKVDSLYRYRRLDKLFLGFFSILLQRPLPLPLRLEIEDTEMDFVSLPTSCLHTVAVADRQLRSLTNLPGKLFVLCKNPSSVLVFEKQDYSTRRKEILIKDIFDPVDVAACQKTGSLYITDVTSSSIWKVSPESGIVMQWLPNVGNPHTISVSKSGNVVFVKRSHPSSLELYSCDGIRLQHVLLPASIGLPNHVVESTANTFFVSTGKEAAKAGGIFEISQDGNVIRCLKSFEPIVQLTDEVNEILTKLPDENRLVYPRYLALSQNDCLCTVDYANGGVMILDGQFMLERDILRGEAHLPLRVCWEKEDEDQLMVIHGEKSRLDISDWESRVFDAQLTSILSL